MQKRDFSQLAIYQIQESMEVLPVRCLRSLYLEKTSEIVYITKDDILYGIVSKEDLFRTNGDIAPINKSYTALQGFNVIKAHEIFAARRNIHKLPVINEAGQLLGDYSCWDDGLYIERHQRQIIIGQELISKLECFNTIYVIEPLKNKQASFKWLLECLENNQIECKILTRECLIDKLSDNSLFIFVDEDEKRGSECLLRVDMGATYNARSVEKSSRKSITYKDLISEILQETNFEKYKISNYSPDNIDKKATVLLTELGKRGIKCFCFYLQEDKPTEYGKIFSSNIRRRVYNKQENINKEEFYNELYKIDDYITGKAQQEIEDGAFSFEYKKNIKGKYFNAKEGRRETCFQKEESIGTIYLLGPCTIIGHYVEDQYTIASYLQRRLSEKGYAYKVENYGSMLREDSAIDVKLRDIGQYCKTDIVVYLSRVGKAVGIQGKSLEKIFESHQIPSEWVTDDYTHCNHKANRIIADSIFETIDMYLYDKADTLIKTDISKAMKKYVYEEYISTKDELLSIKDGVVGSIVMNCNPFTRGHRYLIEESAKKVDVLIVFVVEEDRSLFTFEERYWLVKEGTKDLDNVKVVPSGQFILSDNNFNEYFTKKDNEVAMLNCEYDIKTFADYIAEPLHISYRFAGEEPIDPLTNIYNEAMQKILPDKGIRFIEIPRKAIDGQIVSASIVRKHLEKEEYEKAFALVPETTKRYLKKQCGF